MRAAVEESRRQTDGGPVTLLAHSAGGWLARVYLLSFGTEGEDGTAVSWTLNLCCAPLRKQTAPGTDPSPEPFCVTVSAVCQTFTAFPVPFTPFVESIALLMSRP